MVRPGAPGPLACRGGERTGHLGEHWPRPGRGLGGPDPAHRDREAARRRAAGHRRARCAGRRAGGHQGPRWRGAGRVRLRPGRPGLVGGAARPGAAQRHLRREPDHGRAGRVRRAARRDLAGRHGRPPGPLGAHPVWRVRGLDGGAVRGPARLGPAVRRGRPPRRLPQSAHRRHRRGRRPGRGAAPACGQRDRGRGDAGLLRRHRPDAPPAGRPGPRPEVGRRGGRGASPGGRPPGTPRRHRLGGHTPAGRPASPALAAG